MITVYTVTGKNSGDSGPKVADVELGKFFTKLDAEKHAADVKRSSNRWFDVWVHERQEREEDQHVEHGGDRGAALAPPGAPLHIHMPAWKRGDSVEIPPETKAEGGE